MRASHRRRHLAARQTLMIAVVALASASRIAAHEGPPFPILMDEPAGEHVVSVWADPDIGEATFYIIVEGPGGGPPDRAPHASMWVEPVSGRLDRVTYEAERQAQRNKLQFVAQPHFDRRDMWNVGFQLTGPGSRPVELTTQVESTPPGFGPWDLAIYLFPFVLLGGFWAFAMLRRHRARWQRHEAPSSTGNAGAASTT